MWRGKLLHKQWTLWTETLITAQQISAMPLKCSPGIRVLTENMPLSFFTFGVQSHEWVLCACDSWWLISRQPAAVRILAWMSSSSPVPPAPQLSLRPAYSADAVSTSSHTEPAQDADHFTGYKQNKAQAPSPSAPSLLQRPLPCPCPKSHC